MRPSGNLGPRASRPHSVGAGGTPAIPANGVVMRFVIALIAAGGIATGAEVPPEHIEFFESKIRPIFADSCYKCHSAESGKSKGDLMLDSRDALRVGGASGAVIVPGEPDK